MPLPPNPARRKAIQLISQMRLSLPGDPLIHACYWDIVFMLNNWENFYGAKSIQGFEASLSAIRNAIQQGYPTAYFYNELGSLYLMEKEYKEI